MVAIWIAAAATVVCAWAEWLHARRIRRVAYLAFGPVGRPAAWTRAVGLLRTVSVGAVVWGLVALWQLDGANRAALKRTAPSDDDIVHLVVALDVSPSMDLADAGPTTAESRATRARDVLRSMLERLDLRRVRVSVIPFFSQARPVVIDTFDPEVVANILADLPLEQAFSSGKTNMYAAVEEAGKIGAKWRANSATLILVSDGDTLPLKQPLPPAAAFGDVLIVGVGDAHRGQYIDGHVSRQDATSLEQLALRLGGEYFDANTRQIPTSRVAQLAVVGPREERRPWDDREAAVAAVLIGASCLALVGPLLAALGALGIRLGPGRTSGTRCGRRARGEADRDVLQSLVHSLQRNITMTTPEPSRNGTISPDGVVDARGAHRASSRGWVLPLAIGLWLVTAVAAAAWHYGPGQRYSAKSAAAETEAAAKGAVARGDWDEAVKQYSAALALLPPEEIDERRRLTLSHATSRIQIGELAEAQEEIQALMEELERSPDAASASLLKAARHEAGVASSFAAWLMRLEGAAADEWKVETERSRQQFHLLAEQATADGERSESTAFQKNLEAAIKLEQMDESTLVGRPLPKKCPNCCKNLSQRKRKQSESRCESDKKDQDQKKKPEDDARKQVKEQRKAGFASGDHKGS